MHLDPVIVLGGATLGVILGLTGIGAGSLLTPALIVAVHVRPVTAVGTSLAFSLLTKSAGALQHLRQGTVEARLVGRLAMGSLPSALLSLGLVRLLAAQGALPDAVVQRLVGIVVVLVAALMTIRFAGWLPAPRRPLASGWFVALGAFLGASTALTSVGSGTIAVALLAVATPLAAPALVGSDLAHAALLALATAPFYLAAGHVDVGLVAQLGLGALPGVVLGSRLAVWVPERVVKGALVVAAWTLAVRLI